MKRCREKRKQLLALCMAAALLLQADPVTVFAQPQVGETSTKSQESEPEKETVLEENTELNNKPVPEEKSEQAEKIVPEEQSNLESGTSDMSTPDISAPQISTIENPIENYAAANEWTGQAVNGGQWVISAGKTVELTDSSADIYFANATLTIEEGATLSVTEGILRFNQSTVKGTVHISKKGTVRPWGEGQDRTSVDHIILDGGVLWGADGASVSKIELNDGYAEIDGTDVDELVQADGELMVWDTYSTSAVIKNYLQTGGTMNCAKGGRIQTAKLYDGYAVILTKDGRGGSIDQVELNKWGELLLKDAGATVNRVIMTWGEEFFNNDYPKVDNKGTITEFEGSGGYVENYGTVTNVTLLDDVQKKKGVDFRNGFWVSDDTPGQVDKLTMDYGWFYNDNSSILKSATVYDGFLNHFSSKPIPYMEMLASKNPGKDVASPNGASVNVEGPSVLDTLKFSQGDLILQDSTDDEGAVIDKLIKTDDFAGTISVGRFSKINSELTGMASVTWNKPLNGSIKVMLNGRELSSGALVTDGSTITISALPTDDTIYKLKSNSFTANDTVISDGTYAISGNTTFSAEFILKEEAQPWDGSASITTPDTYEVTTPIVITERRSICEGAEIHITQGGSITVSESGSLENRGTIHGLITLSVNRGRIAVDNLVNRGFIEEVIVEAGTNLQNHAAISLLEISGGSAKNYKDVENVSIKKNGLLENSSSNALVKNAAVTNGTMQNYAGAVIESIKLEGGLVNNIGAIMKNVSLLKGKIINKNDGNLESSIENIEAQSGTIENGEGAKITKLNLLADNDVIMDNKGTIGEQTGNLITGYRLDDNTITVTENAYFNKDPSFTITWNPVVPIGSNTTAPVAYRLRVYDNESLRGEPISDVTYSSTTTWGGAAGKKFKHNTTYYLLLEAKVVGGNVEKDKVFTYKTNAITTLPNPEEIGALNVDKITLNVGGSFQFVAYDALGKPVKDIPLTWSVQGSGGNVLTSRETAISKDGLLHVGADETSKEFVVSCTRADGYFTTYQAVVTISDQAVAQYPITVNATEGGKAWATAEEAEEEAYVLLFAEAYEGYKFERWETSAGEILLPTTETPFTHLSMPNEEVTVTAHFAKIPQTGTETPGDTGTDTGTGTDTDTGKRETPSTSDMTQYETYLFGLICSLFVIILCKNKMLLKYTKHKKV